MAWDDDLEGVAYDIASCESPQLRVMAGPGTGKSFAIKRRVARLIEECGVQPEEILAVTFTRVAANDLKNDLLSLAVPGVENIRYGTLHSFCFRLLLSEDFFEYLDRHPRPLLTYEDHKVLRYEGEPALHDLTAFGATKAVTQLIKGYEAAWARLQADEAGVPRDETERRFERHLVEWLKFHKAILIGELIPITLKVLQSNPALVEGLRIRHVIVDEYQDLNKSEQELIHKLATHGEISIVGDVDQSIYSFKHAHPDGILSFNDRYEDAHDETINICRRCPCHVVDIANSLIINNYREDRDPPIEPHDENCDGNIHIVQWDSSDDEAEGIALYAQKLVEEGYAKKDILILCPRRKLATKLSEQLSAVGLSSYSFFPENMYDDSKTKESISLLSLFCDRDDAVSLRYLLGSHRTSNWNAPGYAHIMQRCSDGRTPYDVLEELADQDCPRNLNSIMARFNQIQAKLAELDGMSTHDIVQELFTRPDEEEETEYGIHNIAEEILLNSPDIDVYGFTRTLRELLSNPEPPDCEDDIKIMSIHKSKGLSSRVVIITGCVNGILPKSPPTFNDEQRRLFYVGITRTKEILVLSSFASIPAALAYQVGLEPNRRGAGNRRCRPSPFLLELGENAPDTITGRRWAENNYE